MIELGINMCYHCATKVIAMLGALHVSSYVTFIEPNSVFNWYHKSTF
jgi:hypothetical protein